MSGKRAAIFGVSGVTGRAVAERLVAEDWNVTGVSRRPPPGLLGVKHRSLDLRDSDATHAAFAGSPITHVFYCAWIEPKDSAEKARLNAEMIGNALEVTAAGGVLCHAALVTGLSHYMGGDNEAPFTEDMPRGTGNPFYQALEEILRASAAKHGFSWSVARPGTILGYAPGNAMNLGTAVAVYAVLCRETGRPFVFPGSAHYHSGIADVTDARLLASHMIWEATSPAAANMAFNVVNGDVFRWKTMWARIAAYFGVAAAPYPGHQTNLAEGMVDAQTDWDLIVDKYGLAPNRLEDIAPFWHVDMDLGRPADTMADMTRSRRLGFLDYQPTWDTFADLFARLSDERIIPKA